MASREPEPDDTTAAAFLLARYGAGIVAELLPTEEQRRAAWAVHERIAGYGGDSLARCWMIGLNPHLDDVPPLLAISEGRYADVEQAAKAYETGAFA